MPPSITTSLSPFQAPAIRRDPLAFLLHSAAEVGDFVHYPAGRWHVYLANHPDLIRHVLQDNNRNYSKNTLQYNTLAQVTGRGLLTSDGRFWLDQRRLVQPAFHRRRIAAWGEVMVKATAEMLDRWEAEQDTKRPHDVDAAMMQLTLEIVGKTLFNLDLRHEAQEMTEAVLELLDYVIYRATHLLVWPLSVPTPRNRRYQRAITMLDKVIYETIAARRASGQDEGDVLSMLLQACDEETGQGMPDAQIRDEMVTLIIAGHETVASALTWCWYLLAQHPTVRKQLEAELDEVLGGRLPTAADLPYLPYTRAVFDETLRLFPPAWLITRRALADDPVGIRAGGIVVISPYVIHRHADYWPEPLAFEPQRFMPETTAERPRFAYIPFGGGPRRCVGDQFALLEGPLLLAAVAQRFRLDLLPNRPVKMEALVTLRPRGGLWMTAARR